MGALPAVPRPAATRLPSRWPIPRSPQLALSFATLAAVGFSLSLLAYQIVLGMPARQHFLVENTLGAEARARLLLTLIGGALAPPAVAGAVWLRRGPRSELGIRRWARLLSPLVLAFAVPVLFVWRTAQANPLMYLVLLTAFGLAARPLVAQAIRELAEPSVFRADSLSGFLARFHTVRAPAWLPLTVVLVAATGYTAYVAYFTILNHRLLQTTAFDLGIYDNLMYNAMSGRIFRSPVLFGPGDRSYLAGHAEYAMVLFVPFYAIRPHAETLLLIQAVVLGFAALPLYLLGKHFLSRGAAALIAVAYLLFAPLHGPNFYDFHWLPLAIFFHFWLYWSIAKRKNWLTAATLLVLFAIREDVAIGVAMLGVFLFLTGARARLGLAMAAVASVWFVINKFIIMPAAGSWWFENIYAELFADGKASYGSVIVTLLSNPVYALATFVKSAKLQYGLHMVAPLVFLPLRKPVFLLLLIPGASFTLMTTGYWPTVDIAFQYTTHWIPYLFLATVLGLWLMRFELQGAHKRSAALAVLCVTMLSHSYAFGAVLQRESFKGGFLKVSFDMGPEQKARYDQLMSLVRRIPRDASVAATEYVNPHISARKDAYAFRYDFGPVDYILVTSKEMHGDNRRLLGDALKKRDYGLLARAGEFYLLKKNHESPETKDALRQLGIHSGRRR